MVPVFLLKDKPLEIAGDNYQVSISDKVDFSTHTYQQDFHVAPNPRKIIQLDASGKQGRYVRITSNRVGVSICAGLCGMFSKG
jgi:hypothetical protein